MPRAFVLVNVEAGAEEQVLKRLREFDFIEQAYVSYGVYDLLVKVNANTMEHLKEAITYKIRTANQVRSTLTLIIIEETPKKEK